MKKYLFIVLMTSIFVIGAAVFLINSAQTAEIPDGNGGGACQPDYLLFTPTSRPSSSANINVSIDPWFDEICDIRYVRHCWTTGSSCDPGTTAANTTGCRPDGCDVIQTVDGEWTLCAKQRDLEGLWSTNRCSAANAYIKEDSTPPTVPTPTDAGSATNVGNLEFYGTPSDGGSGLNTCYAQIKNQSGTIVMGTTNVGADGDHIWAGTTGNTYYYHYYCTDNAGNSSAWSAWSNGIYLDQTPPSISFAPTSRGWSSANISVTIDAPDSYTVTQYIRHCWTTGSSCSAGTTSASTCTVSGYRSCVVSQTGDGSWTLCSRARDGLGNWSPNSCSTAYAYKKETTAPTTSALTATPSGWTASDVTITGTVSDTGGSGVAGYYKKCRPGDSYSYSTGSSISFVCSYTGGVNAFAYGKDNAGNTDASPSYKGYYKDNIAPITSALTPDIVTSPTNFATGCVVLSGSISDEGGSGMTNWQWKSGASVWYWSSNWQPSFPYIRLASCSETGPDGSTFYARGVDGVGNTDATPSSATTYVDLTGPTCGSWSPATSPWKASGTQLFTLSGSTDGGSGIDVAGGNCTTGSTHGSTCTVGISDNAGNPATCTSPPNRVDTAAPTPNPSTGSAVTTCGASTMDVTWTINTASDGGGSGLNSTAYSFNNGSSWQSSNTLVESGLNLDPGQYSKTIKTRDAVGNPTTAGTITSEQCAPGEATVTSVEVIVGPSNVNLSWSGTADGFHVYKQGSKRDTAISTVGLNASPAGTLITNMECPEDYTIKIVGWNTDPNVAGVDTSCSGIDDANLDGKKCTVNDTSAQIRDCTRGFFFD